MKLMIFFFLIVLQFPLSLLGQHTPSRERTDFSFRRKTDIAANLVRTSIFNRVITGREGGGNPDQIPYEWPKNSGKRYMALTSLMVGGVVTLDDGTQIKIFEAGLGKGSSPEGDSWDFNPIPEYLNPDSPDIANQADKDSWPTTWPDKMDDVNDPGWSGTWNGLFGKDQKNADQELFFRAGDDHYSKFPYYPDSTDLSRHGMGLLIDTRVLQWSQVLIQDVTFLLHFFKNDGDKDIERFGVSVLLADLVGGDGDSDDDIAFYNLREEIAWSTDSDLIGNPSFKSDPVGVVATTFLETPGNPLDNMDNDFDGEAGSPKVTAEMISGEDPANGIDDNENSLIDENKRNTVFDDLTGQGPGSAYKDYIDNDYDGELNSPVVTEAFLVGEIPDNAIDDNGNGLIDEDPFDVGLAFADGIDNDNSCLNDFGIKHGETGSPVVTEEMVNQVAADPWRRFYVPNTNLVLYDLGPEDIGKAYRDEIDNDNDGATDEGIDEGIDEMIDETRDDGIDNDGDWDPQTDDVGLDGAPDTGDPGENDGKPTSGAGTNFPGEPNIDKTDVAESDQIGLTNAQYSPSSGLSLGNDTGSYRIYLTPGSYYTTQPQASDYNLFIGSGLFKLRSGATERISLAIAMGIDTTDARNNRKNALTAYESDYQFAQAPYTPKLTAVPGDGKVTLYWDNSAEQSFDRFLNRLGENPNDFEGYRLYRSTDAALYDPAAVTDAQAVPVYQKPLVQFDLEDHWQGIHPVSTEDGAHFYLGNNTGLQHVYVDTPVTNGQRYFYLLRSFDYGLVAAGEVNQGIIPTESPFRLIKTASGKIIHGPSVAVVTPNPPAAGYVQSHLENGVEHVAGASFSKIQVNMYDPEALKDGQRYRISFEDTTIVDPRGIVSDTLRTSNFTLAYLDPDGLVGDTLIARQENFELTDLVFDGFNLIFKNVEQVRPDVLNSYWNNDVQHTNPDSIHPYEFRIFVQGFDKGKKVPYDYEIVFGEPGISQSIELTYGGISFKPTPVNLQIYNKTLDKTIQFAFYDADKTGSTAESALFSRTKYSKDALIFVEELNGEPTVTWLVTFASIYNSEFRNPQAGDVLQLTTEKPFLNEDIYEFTIRKSSVDQAKAKDQLDKIRVVPNPYIAAARWEPLNNYGSGRGPRAIHFNHLPQRCTIRIFNVMGELVRTIEHDSPVENGTTNWDLLTQDQLAVAYGIYIYHVEAPGVGSKTGRLAIIK